MIESPATPIIRPVGDTGVLVEFGDRIDDATHRRVLAFDAALAREPFEGFTESVPAFASVFVGYDPLVTHPAAVSSHVETLMGRPEAERREPRLHTVEVCYEPPFAPDLTAVAERLGLTPEAVVAAHLAGEYQVYLYGFAPGYAYLGGVPEAIRLPRKPEPVRAVPAGSVIIAGPQCLVTTLTMPTGWWIIGRSPTRILSPQSDTPFLFEVGDRVRFTRVDEATLARREAAP